MQYLQGKKEMFFYIYKELSNLGYYHKDKITHKNAGFLRINTAPHVAEKGKI